MADIVCLRMLVVEDEAMLALDLEMLLEEWGQKLVGCVASGAGAIRYAREMQPDIILMDVNLADEIDGITAAKEIRKSSDVPIIFMTAYSDPEVMVRLADLNAPVLNKPFAPERLRELLAAVAQIGDARSAMSD